MSVISYLTGLTGYTTVFFAFNALLQFKVSVFQVEALSLT